ncbi:MAG: O-antigen ligase family protein [Patescibacteria group bacterium]
MTSWLIPLLIFLITVVVAWRSPRAGLFWVVLAIPAYVIKFNIGALPTTLTEIMLWAVLVGWLTQHPLSHLRRLVLSYRPIGWELGLLFIGLVIGIVVSGDWRLSLGIVKGWFVDPLIVYGLVVVILGTPKIHDLVPVLMLSTLPISLTAIIQVITRQFVTIDGRASAWFASANYLALYLVPIILLGSYLLFEPRYRHSNFFFWLITIPSLIAVYFSYSYGGWLALAVGTLVIIIWQFRQRWQIWIAGGLAVVLAGLTQLSSDRVARMLDFRAQSSFSVRLQVWAADLLMIKDRWLTGIGLGQYPTAYPEFVGRLFPSPLEPAMLHAHNLFFQFIINLGVIGLIGFLSLLVRFFSWVARSSTGWAVSLTAAMSAILVHGLVDTPYWKNDLSILFWLLLAIASLTSLSKSATPAHG